MGVPPVEALKASGVVDEGLIDVNYGKRYRRSYSRLAIQSSIRLSTNVNGSLVV